MKYRELKNVLSDATKNFRTDLMFVIGKKGVAKDIEPNGHEIQHL